jgi:hypothetical protein
VFRIFDRRTLAELLQDELALSRHSRAHT